MSDEHEDDDAIYTGWRTPNELVQDYAAILKGAGLSDCPYNMTACRLAMQAAGNLHMGTGNTFVLRILYSETMGCPALFVGVLLDEDQFAPMFMVMTSEFIGCGHGLALSCGGEGCDHTNCEAIPEGIRHPAPQRSDTVSADIGIVNEAFAPIVESLGAELPRYEDLADYYIVEGREDEGR